MSSPRETTVTSRPITGTDGRGRAEGAAQSRPPTRVAFEGSDQSAVLRNVRRVGLAALAVQLAGFLILGALEFRSGALSFDFTGYAQAWWLLSPTQLDPYVSTLGLHFLANDAELILWPLTTLRPLFPSSFVLIASQAVAVSGAGLIALWCSLDMLDKRVALGNAIHPAVPWAVLVAVVLDPWAYLTVAYPFHIEPFVGLLVMLAVRELWAGRRRRGLVIGVLLVVTGTVGCLSMVGLGLGEVLARRGRSWAGVALVAVGLGWLLLLGTFHLSASGGRLSTLELRYLVPHAGGRLGLAEIARGAVLHLGRLWANVRPQLPYVALVLLPLGLIGAATWRGATLVLTVFGPAVAFAGGPYASPAFVFQVWPALLPVLVGSVSVLARFPPRRERLVRDAVVGWALLVAVFELQSLRAGLPGWLPVTSQEAATIRALRLRIPVEDEVVISQGIAGRFADRSSLELLMHPVQALPINRRTVFLILAPDVGQVQVSPASTRAFAAAVASRLGAQLVVASDGVFCYRWRPAAGIRAVIFPSGALLR